MKRSRFVERSIMTALSFLQEAVFSDEIAAQKGFLQAREPRLKALGIAFLLLGVLFAPGINLLIAVYLFCLLLAFCSAIPLWFFLRRSWFFIPCFAFFIALPALFQGFSPGEPLLTFKLFGVGLCITRQGVLSAAVFFLRVLVSVSLAVLLSLTTRHYALLKALRAFGVPQLFVMTLGMCYRYLYLFIEVLQHTYLALKSRSGSIGSSLKGQRVVAANIAYLWQRSYHLHSEVYQAMLSRGYRGEPVSYSEFKAKAKDWLCLAAGLLFCLGVICGKRFLG